MKTYNLSRESKMFNFLNKVGIIDWRSSATDFCTVTRRSIGAFFTAVTVFVMCLMILSPVFALIASIYKWFTTDVFKVYPITVFGFTVYALLGALIGVLMLADRVRERRSERQRAIEDGLVVEQEPNFVVAGYRAFKDKTCVRITFTD